MKKWIVTLALLASTGFAQDKLELKPSNEIPTAEENLFVPNGVITGITATLTNSGSNPSFKGVKLEGTIKAGGNSCEAQRYTVGIKKSKVGGKIVFTPFVKTKAATTKILCIALYDASFLGLPFEKTFLVASRLLDSALVANVKSEGNMVTLSSLLVKDEDVIVAPAPLPVVHCGEVRLCTKEYAPKVCSIEVGGKTFSARGNNACEANGALRQVLCGAKVTYDVSKVSCVRDDLR